MRMKKIYQSVAVATAVLCLTGCGKTFEENSKLPVGAYENEILTTTAVNQEKTMITARYEYGVPNEKLEELIEKQFPNVDIVMVHDGSDSRAYTLENNFKNGIEQDLIFSRSLPSIQNIAEEYLVELSEESFVDAYLTSALDSCADKDNRLFFLPGASDIYGVVYDRTMFLENGWEVPTSYTEMKELIQTINEANLTTTWIEDGEEKKGNVSAINLSLMYPDAFQIMFNTYAYQDVYRDAENMEWIRDYQNGTTSMLGHMEPAAEKFLELVDAGLIEEKHFDTQPWDRSYQMYKTHETAMIVEKQQAYQNNQSIEENDAIRHEIGMFPFWTSDEENSDYLYAMPSYYMAINRASAEESKEKKQLLLDIFEYLSQVDTQQSLLGESSQISNVKDVPLSIDDFTEGIRQTIEEGRIIHTFFFAGNESESPVEWSLRDHAVSLIRGEISAKEWLLMADEARDHFINGDDLETVYGDATETFSHLETMQLVGDMYREVTGAEIALVYSGTGNEGVTGKLYQGDITDASFLCFSPTRRGSSNEDGIAVGTLTGQQILDCLNGNENMDAHVFTIASGLNVEFNPWAKLGNRVLSCTLPDGTKIENEKEYRVAYFTKSLRISDDDYIVPYDERVLEGSFESYFIEWIQAQDGKVDIPELTTTLIWEDKNEVKEKN